MALKINFNVKKVDEKPVKHEPEEDVITTLNVFDLSLGIFAYATSKTEMLSYMQPHCIDVAITEGTDKDSLKELVSIINFKSTLLLYDKYKLLDERGKAYLFKKGYEETGVGYINKEPVYEYCKPGMKSYIQAFDKLLPMDMISLLFVGELSFDSLAYCDSMSCIDMLYYSLKKGRSLILATPFNDVAWANEYLEEKEKSQVTFKAKKTQYLMF